MSQLSVIAALQYELVSPKGTQEGEEYLPTGRPGVLRFMGLQRVGRDCATELN